MPVDMKTLTTIPNLHLGKKHPITELKMLLDVLLSAGERLLKTQSAV